MGGMPERLVLPDDAMAVRYFQNLVEDVMTRDVLLRYDVPHPVALQRLVQILMGSMSCR
jgi:predicted AAA+ superfamily ATPase